MVLEGLRLPLMAAPMSIASTPALVSAACSAGVVGCFPAHNAWRAGGLGSWVDQLSQQADAAVEAGSTCAPFAVNINVSRAKPADLLAQEIAICCEAELPIVTTNVGNPSEVVKQVHDWGGIVIHDATTVEQAERAVGAGVDGLMLVCADGDGLDPDGLPPVDGDRCPTIARDIKPWKMVWSGGQSVGTIADLIDELEAEYVSARGYEYP